MSDQAPVFHQGRWWARRGGEWLVYLRGAWMTPSKAASEPVASAEVASLAAGIFGVRAFLSPAIVFVVTIMAAFTAIGLGIAALTARKGRRKRPVIWALPLAVATGLSALAIFGVVAGSAYAVVIFVLPMLIGGIVIGLGIRGLSSGRAGRKGLPISGLVLGAVTVVMCVWGIANVSSAVNSPNPAQDSHREGPASL